MEKTKKWTQGMERLFVLYLFANPVFDLLNGLYIYLIKQLRVFPSGAVPPVTPTLVVRMAVLAAFSLYILLKCDWRSTISLLLILLAGLMSVVAELFTAEQYSLFNDVQYLARFAYNVAAMAVLSLMMLSSEQKKRAKEMLQKIFLWSALFISSSTILCFILSSVLRFRIGFFSYADRFGYRGASGFYYAANEATAILMLLLPVVLSYFFTVENYKDKKTWHIAAAPALVINSLFLIGTKTAFLALFVSVLFVLGYHYCGYRKTKEKKALKQCGFLALTAAALFLVLSLCGMARSVILSFTAFGEIVNEEIDEDSFEHLEDEDMRNALIEAGAGGRLIFSGRTYYLQKAAEGWTGSVANILFGVGRGSQKHVIEMDFFEMLFYYGLFGFVVLLAPYVSKAWGLWKRFFGNKHDLLSWCVLLAIALTVGYAFMAGHVFFSVTGGFYLVLMIIYGELVLPPEREKSKKAKGRVSAS